MKLRLRRHETRETLKIELTDTDTLLSLQQRLNPSAPLSVHLSLNRKDELLTSSPSETLRSLGVTSGDLIYYSLDHSAFNSSSEPHQSEMNQPSETDVVVEDPPAVGSTEENPEPMDIEQELDVAGSKRLSVPFFLKNILLEKSGDTSELTTLALSLHAVMLESGFVLFGSGSDRLSFSEKLFSVSLKYTLPELISRKEADMVESVIMTFRSLGHMVLVYGTLVGSSDGRVHRTSLDKRRFVPVIDLVMDTLLSDKEGSSSIYREVFMFWRMVKDGIVTPLLIDLCDKAGLELPPCLMRLPTELKIKILESLPGVGIANMGCVCTEMRYLASDNDLWKKKCVEEVNSRFSVAGAGDSVNWKAKFAAFWRQKSFPVLRHNNHRRRSNMRLPRIIGDPPFTWFSGDRLIQPGQPARGFGGRLWGRGFSPRCNLGGRNE